MLEEIDVKSWETEMIDGLAGVKNKNETVVFVCGECGVIAEQAYGAQNKDQLAYLLICPKCGTILGEWTSTAARETELREFAKTVKLRT
jgi:predicted RNA-binding Zn-ribbon protein involved in translation (DUF1610 family)